MALLHKAQMTMERRYGGNREFGLWPESQLKELMG